MTLAPKIFIAITVAAFIGAAVFFVYRLVTVQNYIFKLFGPV